MGRDGSRRLRRVESADATLGAYGWDDRWSALFASVATAGDEPGRIVRYDRALPLVATAEGLVHLPRGGPSTS